VLRVARDLGGEFASEISELHLERGGVMLRSLKNDCVLVLGQGNYEGKLKKYFLLQDTLEKEPQTARRIVDLRFEDQVVLRGEI